MGRGWDIAVGWFEHIPVYDTHTPKQLTKPKLKHRQPQKLLRPEMMNETENWKNIFPLLTAATVAPTTHTQLAYTQCMPFEKLTRNSATAHTFNFLEQLRDLENLSVVRLMQSKWKSLKFLEALFGCVCVSVCVCARVFIVYDDQISIHITDVKFISKEIHFRQFLCVVLNRILKGSEKYSEAI